MIDSHCHLDHEPLFKDISNVLKSINHIYNLLCYFLSTLLYTNINNNLYSIFFHFPQSNKYKEDRTNNKNNK